MVTTFDFGSLYLIQRQKINVCSKLKWACDIIEKITSFSENTTLTEAYLRGEPWCHAPPLGRQDSIISIEWHAKVRHAPPPLSKFGTKFEDTNRQNLTEDFFLYLVFTYFWSKNQTKSE